MEIINRGVGINYNVVEEYEAGLVLTGAEARAARLGRASLVGSYVKFVKGELYWINGTINSEGEEETRLRKLLVHKKQLETLEGKMAGRKLTLIPIRMYNKGRLVKLMFGLVRPLGKHEKRDKIKKKDVERDIERALKEFN